MRNKTIPVCLAILAGLLGPLAQAQAVLIPANDSAPAPSETSGSDPAWNPADNLNTLPDEIVTTGTIPKYQLRKQIFDAQDELHAIFNKLNDDDRLDIKCTTETRLHSHIRTRFCQTNLYRDVSGARARAYLSEYASVQGAPGTLPAGSAQAEFGLTPEAVMVHQRAALRKKIEELANTSPEYRAAIIRYVELKQRYTQSFKPED